MTTGKDSQALLVITFAIASALMTAGCAPLQPTSPTGPRGNEAVYPVLIVEDNARRETAEAALTRLTQPAPARNGELSKIDPTQPNLSPITATIKSLPSTANLYLPKVGTGAVMNEEETRESLRRFLRDWRAIIGSEPARLSLVDHLVQPDGTTVANYEQRPFRFPIRGDYGKLQIRFAADRRILSIFSSCIPDADRVRSALRGLGAGGALSARLTAEEATKKLREAGTSASDSRATTIRVPAGAQLTPRELVTHVQPSTTRADALEFRVAWEIEISNAAVKLAYVDAITGEIIAVQ